MHCNCIIYNISWIGKCIGLYPLYPLYPFSENPDFQNGSPEDGGFGTYNYGEICLNEFSSAHNATIPVSSEFSDSEDTCSRKRYNVSPKIDSKSNRHANTHYYKTKEDVTSTPTIIAQDQNIQGFVDIRKEADSNSDMPRNSNLNPYASPFIPNERNKLVNTLVNTKNNDLTIDETGDGSMLTDTLSPIVNNFSTPVLPSCSDLVSDEMGDCSILTDKYFIPPCK